MNDNQRIAARLREAAERLEERGDDAFRSTAFHRAADTVERWPRSLREIHERLGPSGLQELPGIGPGIGAAIAEMLLTGRWRRLERLRNPSRAPHGPERVLTYVDDEGIEQSCIVVTDERLSRRLPLRT